MPAFARAMTRRLCLAVALFGAGPALAQSAPQPLLNPTTPVDWWFVFKFNAATGPGCSGHKTPACIFGGTPGHYADYVGAIQWGQQFVYASSANPTLTAPAAVSSNSCVGNSVDDPVGATFNAIYKNPSFYYVVWNDQFYKSPKVPQCGNSTSCSSPWGHSKGIVAWNKKGDGIVMQVSTPSWPASGNKKFPRKDDGNTLGCVGDNDVEVSQHFFALKLNKDDLVQVLIALGNASVVTAAKPKLKNDQIIRNGGPKDVQALVKKLGVLSKNTTPINVVLSSGVRLISKPSKLWVPPWQMVSALLKPDQAQAGVPLRAATWWMSPAIPTTTTAAKPGCWDDSLPAPGPVAVAISGTWDGKPIGLAGGQGTQFNHAKIGVAVPADEGQGPFYSIFGDMNQQGTLAPDVSNAHPDGWCGSSQNGRGGTFYVVDNPQLFESMTKLLQGQTAPAQ